MFVMLMWYMFCNANCTAVLCVAASCLFEHGRTGVLIIQQHGSHHYRMDGSDSAASYWCLLCLCVCRWKSWVFWWQTVLVWRKTSPRYSRFTGKWRARTKYRGNGRTNLRPTTMLSPPCSCRWMTRDLVSSFRSVSQPYYDACTVILLMSSS